jgi:hypothetical protein
MADLNPFRKKKPKSTLPGPAPEDMSGMGASADKVKEPKKAPEDPMGAAPLNADKSGDAEVDAALGEMKRSRTDPLKKPKSKSFWGLLGY